MFGTYRGWRAPQQLLIMGLIMISLSWYGCPPALALPFFSGSASQQISETSPPEVIQALQATFDQYQPQVTIASPKANTVLQDDAVAVQFQVADLPLFKDAQLGLGPHLHVFLDDQPDQVIYDVTPPLVFSNLTPGTHTIRAFAGRPWHESFKNEGAYAQVTFHVFTKTPTHNPDANLPLLTYNRPQGSYGAEPILLDFYLTNAPLHLVAQADQADDVADWRIQVTVNGDRFVVDRWEPLYLKGFKPGKNWVQIAYIDEQGNPVPNVYNNTARLINYAPGGQDALSQLVRGELTVAQAMGMVETHSVLPEAETPVAAPVAPPIPPSTPHQAEANQAEAKKPQPAELPQPAAPIKAPSLPTVAPLPVSPAAPAPITPVAPAKTGGFFDRFRRQPRPPVSPPPKVVAPEVSAPEISAPEISAPEISAPEISAPEVSAPEVSAPKTATPQVIPKLVAPMPAESATAASANSRDRSAPAPDRVRQSQPSAVHPVLEDAPAQPEAAPIEPSMVPVDQVPVDQVILPPAVELPAPTPQTAFDRLRRSPLNSPPTAGDPGQRVAPATPATAPAWMFPKTSPPALTAPAETRLYQVPPPRSRPLTAPPDDAVMTLPATQPPIAPDDKASAPSAAEQ